MIFVKIYGGLGNQLFQYAAARSLAYSRGDEVVIDSRWYLVKYRGITSRDYILPQFSISSRKAKGLEIGMTFLHSLRFSSLLSIPWLGVRHFKEKNFDFDPDFFTIKGKVYIDGYWQSYRYFEQIRDILLDEITPVNVFDVTYDSVYKEILSSNSVSVHIRRGDYVSNKAAANFHGLCPESYYINAIEKINSLVNNAFFYIFTDDVDWVSSNMKLPDTHCFVSKKDYSNPVFELFLMSNCKHNIIANSSFSWWGAWLNKHPEKNVIAPVNWFKSGQETLDLIPSEWIRM